MLEKDWEPFRAYLFTAVANLIFLQLQPAIDPGCLGIQSTVTKCSPPESIRSTEHAYTD